MSGRAKAAVAAIVAAMALGAVGAPGASAVTHTFKVSETPMTLTGVQEAKHRLTFTEHNEFLECEKAHFEGTQVIEQGETWRLHPELGGDCPTSVGLDAVMSTSGCDFIFTGQTTEDEHSHIAIDCGHENAITIDIGSGLCQFEISDTHDEEQEVNQTLDGVHYENVTDPETGKEAVTMEFTVEGIAYRTTGAFCAFVGYEDGGTTEDLAYSGATLLTDKAEQGDVTVVE